MKERATRCGKLNSRDEAWDVGGREGLYHQVWGACAVQVAASACPLGEDEAKIRAQFCRRLTVRDPCAGALGPGCVCGWALECSTCTAVRMHSDT